METSAEVRKSELRPLPKHIAESVYFHPNLNQVQAEEFLKIFVFYYEHKQLTQDLKDTIAEKKNLIGLVLLIPSDNGLVALRRKKGKQKIESHPVIITSDAKVVLRDRMFDSLEALVNNISQRDSSLFFNRNQYQQLVDCCKQQGPQEEIAQTFNVHQLNPLIHPENSLWSEAYPLITSKGLQRYPVYRLLPSQTSNTGARYYALIEEQKASFSDKIPLFYDITDTIKQYSIIPPSRLELFFSQQQKAKESKISDLGQPLRLPPAGVKLFNLFHELHQQKNADKNNFLTLLKNFEAKPPIQELKNRLNYFKKLLENKKPSEISTAFFTYFFKERQEIVDLLDLLHTDVVKFIAVFEQYKEAETFQQKFPNIWGKEQSALRSQGGGFVFSGGRQLYKLFEEIHKLATSEKFNLSTYADLQKEIVADQSKLEPIVQAPQMGPQEDPEAAKEDKKEKPAGPTVTTEKDEATNNDEEENVWSYR